MTRWSWVERGKREREKEEEETVKVLSRRWF
jgi:hypothetical protein